MLHIQYLDNATVSNEVIDIDPVHYVPSPGEFVVPFPEESYPDRIAKNYTRSGNSIAHTPPPIPEPVALPDIDGFYDAVFNDSLWNANGGAFRPVRPQLATTKSAMKSDINKPLAVQMTWEDLKIGLIANLGETAAGTIISMVESYATIYNIPLVPSDRGEIL